MRSRAPTSARSTAGASGRGSAEESRRRGKRNSAPAGWTGALRGTASEPTSGRSGNASATATSDGSPASGPTRTGARTSVATWTGATWTGPTSAGTSPTSAAAPCRPSPALPTDRSRWPASGWSRGPHAPTSPASACRASCGASRSRQTWRPLCHSGGHSTSFCVRASCFSSSEWRATSRARGPLPLASASVFEHKACLKRPRRRPIELR